MKRTIDLKELWKSHPIITTILVPTIIFVVSFLLVSIYALLVLFIAVGSTLSEPIFTHFDSGSNYLAITSSVVLLLATVIYVVFTALIAQETSKNVQVTKEVLQDTQKDREMAYIEKQLEKLYYPLKDYLNSVRVQSLLSWELFINSYGYQQIDGPKVSLDTIAPYTYLASPELKKELDDFLHFIRYQFAEDVLDVVGETSTKKIINDLMEAVDNDILELNDKLNELLISDDDMM